MARPSPMYDLKFSVKKLISGRELRVQGGTIRFHKSKEGFGMLGAGPGHARKALVC